MCKDRLFFSVSLYLCGLAALAAGLQSRSLQAQEDKDQALAGVKCIVAGDNAAELEYAAKHLDGEVYFCCEDCLAEFKANPETYSIKANHQLLVTGQYRQTACPITSMPLSEDTDLRLGGTQIRFCCKRCRSSVDSAGDLEAKAKLVFAKDPFEKGFSPAIDWSKVKCPVANDAVSRDCSVEYRDGEVFLCCADCVETFKASPEKFAAQANHQLAATHQYVQRACPLTGRDIAADKTVNDKTVNDKSVNDKTVNDKTVKVGLVTVGVCCNDCQSKLDSADAEDQLEMVFADAAFEKSFRAKDAKK